MGPGINGSGFKHHPVLLQEAVHLLNPHPGAIMIDTTLGGGGHAEAILEKILPGGTLVGIDVDPDALEAARERLRPFEKAFVAVQDNFANLQPILAGLGLQGVDGILMDLGVSSYQLDRAERGFSYQADVFLDMRMSPGLEQTAADLLERLSREELTALFRTLGEEKWSSRIASFIETYRLQKGPITRSSQLVEIIKQAIPASSRRKGGHPAKRVFQALRMAVNRELDNLQQGLQQGTACLKPGGRMVVIAYHSLEDGRVKKYFQELAYPCICHPKFPVCQCGRLPQVQLMTPKVIFPGPREIQANPRARSARLRAVEKLDAGSRKK